MNDNPNIPDPIEFSFLEGDILKEVEKRTSYFGKMRETETSPDLIDRMSLMDGESFLSREFLDDAREQVYDWLRAFGREIEDACKVEEGTIIYTLQPAEWWDANAYRRAERYIKEALVNFIIYRWFEYVKPDEAEAFFDKYENYAHEAQLAMNAEKTLVQRRFNTPYNTIFDPNKLTY